MRDTSSLKVDRPWPKRLRDKVRRSLRRLQQAACERDLIVFVDEVALYLNPKVGLDWMSRGT